MSGYGGYNLANFTNWYYKTDSNSVGIVARNLYSITLKRLEGVNDFEFRNAELKAITNPVTVKFKSNKDIGFIYDYHYRKIGESVESTPISNGVQMTANEEFTFTVNPVSQDDIDKYNIDVSTGYYMLYFRVKALSINEEVTIEMLPLYPNGLVLDGVDDHLINGNIPAFTDFTVIAKRTALDAPVNSAFLCKGLDFYNVIAILLEFKDNTGNYVSSFGDLTSDIELPESITYVTPTNYNGKAINKGNAIDKTGLCIGMYQDINFWKGVFYKLMLYPKTIPLLQINFLKNLMERDEIIDLNNPIFIKNE